MSSTSLPYGAAAECHVRLAPDALVARCGVMLHAPLSDLAGAVAQAVLNPLDLPPLPQLTVAGDRIVLALEEGLPQVGAVVAGVMRTLLAAGVDPRNVTLVRTRTDERRDAGGAVRQLPPAVRNRLEQVVHDPRDRGSLSMLGVSRRDEPVYLNRRLCDADLVLPIGVARPETSLGYLGIHGVLFPTFTDQRTLQRFRLAASSLVPRRLEQRRVEAEEAAWLLGTQLVIQLVPGQGEQVLEVVAGSAAAVAPQVRGSCEAAWQFHVPRRAGLVVAALPGGSSQQTWRNVARAIAQALEVVEDHGALVLLSDLRVRPGPALRRVARASSRETAQRALLRDNAPDGLAAAQLLRARERVKVYLLSRLDEQLVEDLGLVYLSSAEEVSNLARQYASCTLLANAPRIAVQLSPAAASAAAP